MDAWKKRSSLWFWISLMTEIVLLCLVIAYISYHVGRKHSLRVQNPVIASSDKLTEEECIKVCNTKECVLHSKLLLDNVQETVEPCEDFYEFACGKFMEKTDPEISTNFVFRYSSFNRKILKKVLDNIEARPESPPGKMKTVYDSCLKQGSSEKEALPTLLQMLNNFGIHGWPRLAPDYELEPSLADVVSNLLLYQEYGFVYFTGESPMMEDRKNLTIRMEESPYGKKDAQLRKLEVFRILEYFNLDAEAITDIWDDSETILKAIKILSEESERIYYENENSISSYTGYVECTRDVRDELKDLCNMLELFINSTGRNEMLNKNYANVPISDIYYVKNVFHILGNFSHRSIANYLVLNLFMNHLDDLNFYFRLLYQDPRNFPTLSHYKPIDHWEHCVNWIIDHMTFALAHEYVKDDSVITTIQEAQELIKELIEETKETVSRQEWISNNVLEDVAIMIENIDQTSASLILNIASNDTFVNQFYKEFEPSKRNFLQNVFEYQRFSGGHEIRGLPVREFVMFLTPLFIPGASGGDGELMINPGMLVPPMYTPRLERLINLVSLGTIIAHEIGHSVQSFFMSMFRKSNNSEYDYYNDNSECLDKQFSEFRIESLGKNLKGSKYTRENEADNMATTIIDKVIKKYLERGVEVSMPGVPYSTKQLLYISSAQNWCAVYTEHLSKVSYESGSHSPINFRLLGMMQNSKGFSEAFSCPEGSYMNPSIKCFLLTESD